MSTDQELTTSEIEPLRDALDQIISEYDENNKIIFESESERVRQYFAGKHRSFKNWSKSRQCVVPGCGKQSITRSHTVPKSMSLRVIGEDGHVLVPFHDSGLPTMRRVGLSDATTFPGFCEAHELLFQSFENQKSITTMPEICLQAYRAACREIFRAGFLIEQLDWTMAAYCKARDEGLARLIRERAVGLGLQEETVLGSVHYKNDPLVEELVGRTQPLRDQYDHLKLRLLPALERMVFHSDDSGLAMRAIQIDYEIPIALAGSGCFWTNDHGAEIRTVLLMNVMPADGGTLILMATLAEEERLLGAYVARWMNQPLSILSMIESWMINGSDQWCIRPSVWKKIPAPRASRLLSELNGDRRNVGEECDDSIFDDLRAEFIGFTETSNKNDTSPEYLKFIESEKKKLRDGKFFDAEK